MIDYYSTVLDNLFFFWGLGFNFLYLFFVMEKSSSIGFKCGKYGGRYTAEILWFISKFFINSAWCILALSMIRIWFWPIRGISWSSRKFENISEVTEPSIIWCAIIPFVLIAASNDIFLPLLAGTFNEGVTFNGDHLYFGATVKAHFIAKNVPKNYSFFGNKWIWQ